MCCVALHANLCPICKKCEAQLYSVVSHCGIPASEGGVPEAQGDSVICHRCANMMMKCASNNGAIQKNKVTTAVFCCLHDDCKKPAPASCVPRQFLQKMDQHIFPWKMGQFFTFVVQDMVLPILR